MLERKTPYASIPVKNLEMSISYKGKTYAICEERQLDYLLEEERKRVMLATPPKGKYYEYTEEQSKEIDEKVAAYRYTCGYATLSYVLSLMTPAERRSWQDQYRFSGVARKKK